MLLYRVENLLTGRGLWYNTNDQSDSNLVSDLKLSARELPMDRTDILSTDKWKSAADSVSQLSYWFTKEDLEKLRPLGFDLYEIDASVVSLHTTELYEHPLFQEQGVVSRKKLSLDWIK